MVRGLDAYIHSYILYILEGGLGQQLLFTAMERHELL